MWDRIKDGLWWDKTLSLVSGCTKVSPGCDHCWAEGETRVHAGKKDEKSKQRYGGLLNESGWNGSIKEMWGDLDKINPRQKPTVYTVWNDLFHPDVTWDFQLRVFKQFKACSQHTFIVCTKRPERAVQKVATITRLLETVYVALPLPNVIIMTTVENQEQADIRIPLLLQIPAVYHALSVEPMLGPIDLNGQLITLNGERVVVSSIHPFFKITDAAPKVVNQIDWVVCGGESGKDARPVHPDWVRDLRDQCVAANVPFMFKQWGNWTPGENLDNSTRKYQTKTFFNDEWYDCSDDWFSEDQNEPIMYNVGKKNAGRLLDGRTWDEHPV